MPRHRHANGPVGSGQNGMARTMGLLSRPAGRLPPPRRLQARLAALLLREQFVELLLVGVVVEEVVQLLARLQAVRSEEHTSELQSLMRISYAVFCLKKKKPLITSLTLHKSTPFHISTFI